MTAQMCVFVRVHALVKKKKKAQIFKSFGLQFESQHCVLLAV